jgi:hypothetical protein
MNIRGSKGRFFIFLGELGAKPAILSLKSGLKKCFQKKLNKNLLFSKKIRHLGSQLFTN